MVSFEICVTIKAIQTKSSKQADKMQHLDGTTLKK